MRLPCQNRLSKRSTHLKIASFVQNVGYYHILFYWDLIF